MTTMDKQPQKKTIDSAGISTQEQKSSIQDSAQGKPPKSSSDVAPTQDARLGDDDQPVPTAVPSAGSTPHAPSTVVPFEPLDSLSRNLASVTSAVAAMLPRETLSAFLRETFTSNLASQTSMISTMLSRETLSAFLASTSWLNSWKSAMSASYEAMQSIVHKNLQLPPTASHELEGLLSSISSWEKGYRISLDKFYESVRQLAQATGSLDDTLLAFKTALVESQWPPPRMDLDITDVRYILDLRDSLPKQEARSQIDTFMLERHDTAYVRNLLAEWKGRKWIKKRIPILEAAVNAHIEGKYELSIPALLPQIEGIIWDGYDYDGSTKQKYERDYASKLCKGSPEDGEPDFLDLAAEDFFLKTLLQSFDLGQPMPGLSRHAILHGADTDYATRVNSLKVILIFDYFLNAFGVVSLDDLPTYHKFGCPHVQHGSHRRSVYKNHWAAERAGKKPCRTCHPENM